MPDTYDYIIIGAGSAGCVLAEQLSADTKVRVLLLEAGPPDRQPWLHVPIGYARTMFDTRVNWCHTTQPEAALDGRSLHYPAGRVLGGSSSINGLLYVRGQHEDYDDWARLGNPGWGWQDVLPSFRRVERQTRGADAWHGDQGPLAVSDERDRHPLCDAFIAAAEQLGIPANPDFNGAHQEGVGYYQMTALNGRRMSSARAFLRPARQRLNLVVRTAALVQQLIIDGKAVRSVRYQTRGQTHEVRANRCVVLSAGAIGSPAILQRSGIGPADVLRQAGVALRHELPGVGANLQDHLQAKLVFRSRTANTLNDAVASWQGKLGMGLRYLFERRGWLTVAAGQAGGFVRTRPELTRPDVQFHVMALSTLNPRQGLDSFPGFTVSACQLRPESRGHLAITSADPGIAPALHFNYLATELDRETLLAGLRLGRQIAAASPLADALVEEVRPGPGADDTAALQAYIQARAGSVFHPAGTCRMGPDEMAVVDANLQVHGMEGLAIADASIMPTLVSGNTNAAAIMIGAHAASRIAA